MWILRREKLSVDGMFNLASDVRYKSTTRMQYLLLQNRCQAASFPKTLEETESGRDSFSLTFFSMLQASTRPHWWILQVMARVLAPVQPRNPRSLPLPPGESWHFLPCRRPRSAPAVQLAPAHGLLGLRDVVPAWWCGWHPNLGQALDGKQCIYILYIS